MSSTSVTPVEGQDYFTIPAYRLKGKVVHGFGRGSKLLGFPTANLDPAAFKDILVNVERGVYFGWAKINKPADMEGESKVDCGVFKAMLSLGTSPQFEDSVEDTVEAYIEHEFAEDFYGYDMTLVICAYRRPQLKYDSLEALISAIQTDVDIGAAALDLDNFSALQSDGIFKSQ